jgi:hypothetical protein
VCIFAGDRVRLGDEHPVTGPSNATKKVLYANGTSLNFAN